MLESTSLATNNGTLPIGIGFINWGANLNDAVALINEYRPAAVWLFAPSSISSLTEWVDWIRQASPETKIWVQVGSVKEALDTMTSVRPNVLVVQGTDAGGHGLVQGASLVSLLPEVSDAVQKLMQSSPDDDKDGYAGPVLLAAGGIVEGRGAAAALTLGASGIVLGTRFLASHEAKISKGYQDEVLRASDGGQTTVRTKVYDTLRGTMWADTHNARGIINKSYSDAMSGMSEDENRHLYIEEMRRGDDGWGVENRMTTYAGSAVGLVVEVKPAGDIVEEVREKVMGVFEDAASRL